MTSPTFDKLEGEVFMHDHDALDIIGEFDKIDFNTTINPPAWKEGRIFYDKTNKALGFYNNESDVTAQIPYETWVRGYNNSGVTILNGQVICISGEDSGLPTFSLAKADAKETSLCTIAIATHDIEDGTIGVGTITGTVRDVDTSLYPAGTLLFLSDTVAGGYTDVEPESPSYPVTIGTSTVSHVTTGQIQAHINANRNTQSTFKFYNGSILESHTVDVVSDGINVTLTLDDSKDFLSTFFDGEFGKISIPASIQLTPGSDTNPTRNYVYIPKSTGVLTVNTSAFPTNEQIVRVADVIVQTALTAQVEGIRKVHAWTDHLANSVGQGHLTDLNYWIRQQPASYVSGVASTLTPAIGTPATSISIATTAGTILQLHPHDFPEFNLLTGDDIHIYNDSITPNRTITEFSGTSLPLDGEGTSTSNKYFVCYLWGSVSEDAEDCHLFLNLPSGVYTNETTALQDVSKTIDANIPLEFKGTGFAIASIVFQRSGANIKIPTGGFTDLRGTPSGSTAGSGTGITITEFPDNLFKINDNADPTKVATFQAGNITSGTTREFTFPDLDGTLALTSNLTQYSLVDGTRDFTGPITVVNNDTFLSGVDTPTINARFPTTDALTIGSMAMGKFGGSNNGVGLRFQQVEGTDRLIFRGSSAAGAMVWNQPEAGAQLLLDFAGARHFRFNNTSFAPMSSSIDLGITSIPWDNFYVNTINATDIQATGIIKATNTGRHTIGGWDFLTHGTGDGIMQNVGADYTGRIEFASDGLNAVGGTSGGEYNSQGGYSGVKIGYLENSTSLEDMGVILQLDGATRGSKVDITAGYNLNVLGGNVSVIGDITGGNVTSGTDPGHIHTNASITPPGSDGQMFYNNGGVLDATSLLSYDDTTDKLISGVDGLSGGGFSFYAPELFGLLSPSCSFDISNGSFSVGLNAVATGGAVASAIAMGSSLDTSNIPNYSVEASGDQTLAIHGRALAKSCIAIGADSISDSNYAISIGSGSSAKSVEALSIGYNSDADYNRATAIGSNATASNSNALALGTGSLASGDSSTAIKGNATGAGTVAIGSGTVALGVNSVSIGNATESNGDFAVAIGREAIASGDSSMALGRYSSASADRSLMFSANDGSNFPNGADNNISNSILFSIYLSSTQYDLLHAEHNKGVRIGATTGETITMTGQDFYVAGHAEITDILYAKSDIDSKGIISSNTVNGEIRSYQSEDGLYLSLKTDTTTQRSGMFRSNAGYIVSYDYTNGDVLLESNISNSNVVLDGDSGVLFKVNNVQKMELDSSGNLDVEGEINESEGLRYSFMLSM